SIFRDRSQGLFGEDDTKSPLVICIAAWVCRYCCDGSSSLLSYHSGPVRPWDDLLVLRCLAPGVVRYCLARPPGCLSHGFGRLRRARLRACAALPSAEDFFLWHGAHAALRLSSRWSSPARMWSTSLARPTQRSG